LFVKFRPFLLDFVRELKMYYEIVAYSSLSAEICKALVGFVECREGSIFSHVLSKEHCAVNEGVYIKSVAMLEDERSLQGVIVLDCCKSNFMMQYDKVLYLKPFAADSTNDFGLEILMKYLKRIAFDKPEKPCTV
jgi:TFIIF-interacting CTD phosphatase-like protein